jgi:hypothetical protein
MWEVQAYFLLAFSPLQHPVSRHTCLHRLREKKGQERGKEGAVIAGGGEEAGAQEGDSNNPCLYIKAMFLFTFSRKVTIFLFLLGTIPVIYALPFNNPQSLLVLQSDKQS